MSDSKKPALLIDDTAIRQYRSGAGDPMFIHFTDDHMEADEVCMAGWVVEGKKGPLLIGTVVSYLEGGEVRQAVSHGHSYVKNLAGRKVVSTAPLRNYRIGKA